jgi:hypothetical protein
MMTKKPDCLERERCKSKVMTSTTRLGCLNHKLFPKLGVLTATCTGGVARDRALQMNLLGDFTFVSVQDQLARIPQLRAVQPNEVVKLVFPWLNETGLVPQISTQSTPSLIAASNLWHLDRVNQRRTRLDGNIDRCHSEGAGVEVWVLDTGCRPSHQEIRGRVRLLSLLGGTGEDDHGHGTHTAALAAGRSVGVAPQADLVCVKVLNNKGGGSFANIIAAIDMALTEHEANPWKRRVVSMSLGGRPSELLNAAVDRASEAGIPVVVAAGNDNQDADNTSPASANMAIAVSAINLNGWAGEWGASVRGWL